MTQPFKRWTVPPHGKLCEIDANVLTVVGERRMPLMLCDLASALA